MEKSLNLQRSPKPLPDNDYIVKYFRSGA